MPVPVPTPILRLVHMDNLETLIQRGGLHAPNHTPDDGRPYRTIHNVEIQAVRRLRPIPCGPGGTVHDYISFYFGCRSPMLLQLNTGRVAGYDEGQEPLIYLVSTAQAVAAAEVPFVFSDGHGIAAYTHWYDDLDRLNEIDWKMVKARYWADTPEDMDRQRRKQAEFLIYQFCPWPLIREIAVINRASKGRVEQILAQARLGTIVSIKRQWYY